MTLTPQHPPSAPKLDSPTGKSPWWSILWALTPLISFGLSAPVTFGYAAYRLRTRNLVFATALYAAADTVIVVGAGATHGKPPSTLDAIMTLCLLANFLAGTAHALIIRNKVFRPRTFSAHANLAAVQAVLHRRDLRIHSRQILEQDPAMARELAIGRPDLPRGYDDGGLIDINNAPEHVLTTLPGVTPIIAARIAGMRETQGPFISPEHLATLADLDPRLLPDLADYTIYLM